MITTIRAAAATATFAAFAGWSVAATAGSATYTLNRADFTNVGDSLGGTAYEGGTFKNSSGTALGYYNIMRRYTTGGSAGLNVAATTITLFFTAKAGVPPSIVAEGAHDYNGGGFTGGISAASPTFNWVRGGGAAYSSPATGVEKLVLTWTGPKTLP
jgi:hypothetical protein